MERTLNNQSIMSQTEVTVMVSRMISLFSFDSCIQHISALDLVYLNLESRNEKQSPLCRKELKTIWTSSCTELMFLK